MYSFEEEFEDNIWSTLSEDVASTMSECVVSLASFNGDCVVMFSLLFKVFHLIGY